MRILVAGATGSIGIHVVNTAIAMGHQPVALVRNRRKIKLLPRGTDIFYGDVSIPETLTDLPKDIDAIIFTLGSDGQGRRGILFQITVLLCQQAVAPLIVVMSP